MLTVLNAAHRAWLSGQNFRARRERFKRYTYGDQWSDTVADPQGFEVAEAELIKQSGRKPLTNNMIRQIVKTVTGRYRTTAIADGVYKPESARLRKIMDDNDLLELDCRMLEEYLISGCAVQRVSRESQRGVTALRVENVDPRMFFVNSFHDPRGRDIELIGMLHDFTFPEIVTRFGQRDRQRLKRLGELFSPTKPYAAYDTSPELLGESESSEPDFYKSRGGRFRVIEVWTLDCRFQKSFSEQLKSLSEPPKYPNRVPNPTFFWRCRWFAPDGYLLDYYDSPYEHGCHPFTLRMYPLTDGEVHPFVEDVIDQQRCINRMIVLIDHIIGSSAKGVLLFPQDQKPTEVDWRDIAETWARADGVIPITGCGPHLPQQMVTAGADSAAYRLLDIQMRLFDNISGVTDVIAGRPVSAGTGSAVYEAQLRNSTTALADITGTFESFRRDRDRKALDT